MAHKVKGLLLSNTKVLSKSSSMKELPGVARVPRSMLSCVSWELRETWGLNSVFPESSQVPNWAHHKIIHENPFLAAVLQEGCEGSRKFVNFLRAPPWQFRLQFDNDLRITWNDSSEICQQVNSPVSTSEGERERERDVINALPHHS